MASEQKLLPFIHVLIFLPAFFNGKKIFVRVLVAFRTCFVEKSLISMLHILFLLIAVSVANGAVNWTTKPKDSEYFVGSEVIFQWEYSSRSSDAVEFIKFGIKAAGEDVVIINKDMFQKVVRFNKEVKPEVTATFKGRVTALENQTAGFKITNLRMDDSGKYFCFLEPKDQDLLTVDDYVELKVVGKYGFFFCISNFGLSLLLKGEFYTVLRTSDRIYNCLFRS